MILGRDDLSECVQALMPTVCALSDDIFDHPETGRQEHHACAVLTRLLESQGFAVTRGIGSLDTAFRAEWQNGTGGPSIGLLCEYDALPEIGHACAHHMQGPAVIAAAAALKHAAGDEPFRIVVYGTPDEEYGNGKVEMLRSGCFKDIDFALMTHAGPNTTVDIKSLAQRVFEAEFHGISAHAALKPESGRSAVDAMLLSLHGLELLREHVRDDVRMHYSILETSPYSNIVPEYARIEYSLRSYSSEYLNSVCCRFKKLLEGAAMMTETTVTCRETGSCRSKVPIMKLNERIMAHARELNAPQMIPFREKTGSTDFGDLLHQLPGACVRVAFVPEGTSSHSKAYIDAGKSDDIHAAIRFAALILASTAADLIQDCELRRDVEHEFKQRLKAEKDDV